jgi:D-alanine-D-alanine ligase
VTSAQPRKLSVAVVQGGPSTEAEVSRASAAGVARALSEAGHRAVRLELDARLGESLRTGGYDVVFPDARAAAERARREVGARLVVKPSSHGSAIGVARLEADATDDDVARAIEAVWAIDDFAVVEHFARGREVTCGVIELSSAPEALPPTEILSPRDPFYTYEARYAPGRSVHVCPATLPAAVLARVQQAAVEAHVALGCRDLSRVDFVVGDVRTPPGAGDEQHPDAVTLLEVNTLPGMTATSLYPEAAAVWGLPMPRLCDALVTRAHARGPTRRLEARPLPR